MDPSPKLLMLGGPPLAAVIAGLFSYLTLLLAKEQKVSEFRQNGINALREDVATLISAFVELRGISIAYSEERKTGQWMGNVAFQDALAPAISKYQVPYNRLLLRFHSYKADSDEQALVDLLKKMNKATLVRDFEQAESLIKDIREVTLRVLDSEWRHVQKGESMFRWSKWIALGVFVIASLYGIHLAAQSPAP